MCFHASDRPSGSTTPSCVRVTSSVVRPKSSETTAERRPSRRAVTRGCTWWCAKTIVGSTLRVLWGLARTLQTVLLALLRARVACQEALTPHRHAQPLVAFDERARDGMAHGASLAGLPPHQLLSRRHCSAWLIRRPAWAGARGTRAWHGGNTRRPACR